MTGTTTDTARRRRHETTGLRAAAVALLTVLTAAFAVVLPGPTATAAENLPGGKYLFAVLEDNRLVAIDRTTEQVVGSVAIPGSSAVPFADIQTSSDQTTVYLVDGASVVVVDTRTMTVTGRFTNPQGRAIDSFAVSPDGSRLYVHALAAPVDVVQLPSLTLLGQVPVANSSRGFARRVAANATSGYVVTDTGVQVVAPDGSGVTATFPLQGTLGSIVVTELAAYVAQEGTPGIVQIVDPGSGSPFGNITASDSIGDDPMTLSPDGQYLYVGTLSPGLLQRLQVSTGLSSVTGFRESIGTPVAAPDTGVVYVPSPDNSTQMAKIVDWPTVSTLPVPAAALAVTMVDLAVVAPGAPTVTSLTNGDGQVSVGFTPGTPGDSPTTGYRVTATDVTNLQRGGQTATGTASPITVPGLSNGDAYTFTVTAMSADGNSAPSLPSNALTVGVTPIVSGTAPTAVVGTFYKFQFTVTGKPTPSVSIDPTTSLPAGLSFDPTTATLSGAPTTAGTTDFNVLATNALGTATYPVQFIVTAAPSETSPPPTSSPSSPSTSPTSTATPTPSQSRTTPPPSSSRSTAYGSSSSLANTGMPVATFVAVATALLLLGALLVATTRTRRRS